MSIDPTDPETFETPENNDSFAFDVEAAEADAADQHHDLVPHHDDQPSSGELLEANEADRAEQARVVEVSEEDYR
ncbi:hypothetical protein [Streptomyces sp. NPDC048636]|uniref:hypothetical protein n=1 Tax=Streptomyces sp. NPDC048636 TaxID=3155762 RepID=UPI003442F52E